MTDKQIGKRLNRGIREPLGEVEVDDAVVIEVERHGRRNGRVDVRDYDLRVGGRAGEHAHAGSGCSRGVRPELSFEFRVDRGLTASLDARRGKLHWFTCWGEEDRGQASFAFRAGSVNGERGPGVEIPSSCGERKAGSSTCRRCRSGLRSE